MSDAESGKQFYAAVQEGAMAVVKDVYKTDFVPVQYPAQGDFLWNWQNGNQVFNQSTYDYVNARVSPGVVDGTVQLAPGGSFANAYVQLLNALVYKLSSGDQAKLDAANKNAAIQIGTVVADYQNTYGTITDAQRKAAGVETNIDYVVGYVLGSQWSGATPPLSYSDMANARNLKALLPKAPISGDQVIADVSIYLNLMEPVNALQDQLQAGIWTLNQLKLNTQYPTSKNGGMQTFNPVTGGTSSGYDVGWQINKSIADINNGLQNEGQTIEFSIDTSRSSDTELNVNVEGQTGFTVGSFLEFSVGVHAAYDLTKTQGSSQSCSATISYPGVTVVPAGPSAWRQAGNRGFWYPDVIAQAVANGSSDVTGFGFLNQSPFNLDPVAAGGNFGLIQALLISQFPTITIHVENADYSTFVENWDQEVSGNVSLFGFISLGSFSEGTHSSTVVKGADNSSFTITFSPSPAVTSVPTYQQSAYVIGAATTTPGA